MFESLEDVEPLFVIAQRLQKLHLTFEMVVILKALCVFFTGKWRSRDFFLKIKVKKLVMHEIFGVVMEWEAEDHICRF